MSDERHRFVAYPTTKPGCFVVTNRDTEGNIPPRPVRCNRAPDDPIHGERSTPLDWYASVVFVLCLVIITALGAVLLGHVLGWLGIIATDPNVEPTP